MNVDRPFGIRPTTRATAIQRNTYHGYVEVEPDDKLRRVSPEYMPGMPVRLMFGLKKGRVGEVLCYMRSAKAHRMFERAVAVSQSLGMPVPTDAYECLIDEEGPLVHWSDGEVCVYPGKSIAVLEPIKPVSRVDRVTNEIVAAVHANPMSFEKEVRAILTRVLPKGEIDGRLY